MSNVKIVGLGGFDESGKNLLCIEVDNHILIVNAGIKYPAENQYGVEVIVPSFDYLEANKGKIDGCIITHAKDDMMNGLPYLLRSMNLPIYGPKLCKKVLSHFLKPEELGHLRYSYLPRYGTTKIGSFSVTSFGLTHATPDAIGISIDTPDGQIVIAEQFCVDFNMHDTAFDCDINAIAEIGKKKVLALIMEASYADHDGFTSPKHRITNIIRPYFEDAGGRIIISAYNQNYIRIKEIINLTKEFGRSIFFYDARLKSRLQDIDDLGYYSIPRGVEITKERFSNDIEDIVILVTGNGQNIFSKMNRIATGEDDVVELRPSDTVIIASPIVAGSEKKASEMENELYKDNVDIHKLNAKEVLSVHPAAEDIKMMLSLLKPKYFLPSMGEYRCFIAAANLALEIGITADRIIILDNGQVASIRDSQLVSCSDFVDVGEFMVGEENDKKITSFVLRDRETLSTDGVIIIGIAMNYNNKEIIAGPDIQSRGVIYVKDSEYVMKNIGKMTIEMIEERVREGTYDNMALRTELREQVSRYVLKETGKRPMILPAIIEINLPVK